MRKKRRSLREKLAELLRDAVDGAVDKPKMVTPRHRISGPRILPDNWMEIEANNRLPRRDDLPPAA